jgi:two-component system cell cycle response regulator
VQRGRLSELLRALDRATAAYKPEDAFFMQLAEARIDIRDRIARHLDKALFESVIAAEIRALATSESVERLLDRFSQFFSQVCSYRWLALATTMVGVAEGADSRATLRVGLHHAPDAREAAQREAMLALRIGDDVPIVHFEDDDAVFAGPDHAPVLRRIELGGSVLAQLAIAPAAEPIDEALVDLVARELAGPLRLAALVEESRRLAAIDGLTGLTNRRAFVEAMSREVARCERYGHPLTFLMVDVDHFKAVNDTFGHAAGDRVLVAVAGALKHELRSCDVVARWGGEEFVVALTSTDGTGGNAAAERIRSAVEALFMRTESGELVTATVSVGVGARAAGESLDMVLERADRALYAAKELGRNRVEVSQPRVVLSPVRAAAS